MSFYRSPGVYIIEKPVRPTIVNPAGTGYMAIWGKFPWGPTGPVLITSWNDFVSTYGLWGEQLSLLGSSVGSSTRIPALSVYHFFANGGSGVYVYNAISGGNRATATIELDNSATESYNVLTVTAKYPGTYGNYIKIKVEKGVSDLLFNISVIKISGSAQEILEVHESVVFHDETSNNYISKVSSVYVDFSFNASTLNTSELSSVVSKEATLSGGSDPNEVTDISAIVNAFADINEILYFAAPQLEGDVSSLNTLLSNLNNLPYAFLVVSVDTDIDFDGTGYDSLRSDKVAFYYPYVWIANPATNSLEKVSPSGGILGVYFRNDFENNVGKTPAGVRAELRGVQFLSISTNQVQKLPQSMIDRLYPKHFNPIVYKEGFNYVLWGARLSTFDEQWRYINKRRLFYFLQKSIKDAIAWVNFENNTPEVRFAVYNQLDNFLRRLTLEGYFASTAPSEAYYIICDSTNNPPEVVNQGLLVVDIGIAPAKPAEFVVLRFTERVNV